MKYLVTMLFLLHSCALSAQEYKRNYNWVLGLGPVVKFNFNSGFNLSTLSTFAGTSAHNSCISDTNGNLQFYSVGYRIGTKNADLMYNSDSLNCPGGGKMANYYGWGSIIPQQDIIIPKSGKQYYVFATGMSDTNWTRWKYFSDFKGWDYLNYSVVDMDSNNGMGKVIAKNQVILDSQSYDNPAMSAVRHGNGKDWWLVKEDYRKHAYQVFRVTKDSIIGPTYEYVPQDKRGNFWAQSTSIEFSRDGTKMASTMYSDMIDSSVSPPIWDYNRVEVFDFDRCTGKLSYRQHYKVPSEVINGQANSKRGICFSPNGELLYLSCLLSMHQIDLSDTAIYNALKIKDLDTTWAASPWYNTMALGPNNKIYIGNFGGTRKYMSTIDNPDVKGLGCNFHANAVYQPYTNLQSPPNLPNYGLVSEVCWPASNNEVQALDNDIIVYPNPATTILYVQTQKYKLLKKELYNSLGQLVVSSSKNELDISRLSVGMYYLRVGNFTKKIVKE